MERISTHRSTHNRDNSSSAGFHNDKSVLCYSVLQVKFRLGYCYKNNFRLKDNSEIYMGKKLDGSKYLILSYFIIAICCISKNESADCLIIFFHTFLCLPDLQSFIEFGSKMTIIV